MGFEGLSGGLGRAQVTLDEVGRARELAPRLSELFERDTSGESRGGTPSPSPSPSPPPPSPPIALPATPGRRQAERQPSPSLRLPCLPSTTLCASLSANPSAALCPPSLRQAVPASHRIALALDSFIPTSHRLALWRCLS